MLKNIRSLATALALAVSVFGVFACTGDSVTSPNLSKSITVGPPRFADYPKVSVNSWSFNTVSMCAPEGIYPNPRVNVSNPNVVDLTSDIHQIYAYPSGGTCSDGSVAWEVELSAYALAIGDAVVTVYPKSNPAVNVTYKIHVVK
jgi:hypothetical protein